MKVNFVKQMMTILVLGLTCQASYAQKIIRELSNSSVEVNESIEITVKIENPGLKGIAKYQEYIPSGFSAAVTNKSLGKLKVDDSGNFKLQWFNFPANDVVLIQYRLKNMSVASGNIELKGKFTYMENGKQQSISSEVSNFAAGNEVKNAVAQSSSSAKSIAADEKARKIAEEKRLAAQFAAYEKAAEEEKEAEKARLSKEKLEKDERLAAEAAARKKEEDIIAAQAKEKEKVAEDKSTLKETATDKQEAEKVAAESEARKKAEEERLAAQFEAYQKAAEEEGEDAAEKAEMARLAQEKNLEGSRLAMEANRETKQVEKEQLQSANNTMNSSERYSVQVGAFGSRKDLLIFGSLPDVFEKEINGLYKYFSGRFSSEDEARKHLERAKERGMNDAFIVRLK